MMPIGIELVRRARESGGLRDDIAATDIPLVQLMVGAVIDTARAVEPDLWRRYLGILIRGLAADPELEPPLRAGLLAPAQVDHVMSRVSPGSLSNRPIAS